MISRKILNMNMTEDTYTIIVICHRTEVKISILYPHLDSNMSCKGWQLYINGLMRITIKMNGFSFYFFHISQCILDDFSIETIS